jgi:hypothetical protein
MLFQIGLRESNADISNVRVLTVDIADLNSARWKLSVDNVQRRCRLFWQLFYLDTWAVSSTSRLSFNECEQFSYQSFYFGRPPTMSASYIDCPFPLDPDEAVSADGGKKMSCRFSFNS